MFFEHFYLKPLLLGRKLILFYILFYLLDFHINYLWGKDFATLKNRNVLKTNGVDLLRVHPDGITPGKLIRVNLLVEIRAHKSEQVLSRFKGLHSVSSFKLLTDRLSAEVPGWDEI